MSIITYSFNVILLKLVCLLHYTVSTLYYLHLIYCTVQFQHYITAPECILYHTVMCRSNYCDKASARITLEYSSLAYQTVIIHKRSIITDMRWALRTQISWISLKNRTPTNIKIRKSTSPTRIQRLILQDLVNISKLSFCLCHAVQPLV